MTNKLYIQLSINRHTSVDALKGLFLDELNRIDENDLTSLVTLMGRVSSKVSGIFKQADEFAAQGITQPTVLAAFTPLAASAAGAFTSVGPGLESLGAVVSAKAYTGITVDTNGISITGFSNLPGTPSDISSIIGTTTLDTSSQNLIGAINELRTDINGYTHPSLQVQNSDNNGVVNVNIALAGATPTGDGNGLARLKTGERSSIIDSINSFAMVTNAAGSTVIDVNQALAGTTPDTGMSESGLNRLTTADKTSIVDAINELKGQQVRNENNDGNVDANVAIAGSTPTADANGLYSLRTGARSSIIDSINSFAMVTDAAGSTVIDVNHALAGATPDTGAAGSGLNRLTTADKTSIVDAINELNNGIGNVSTINLTGSNAAASIVSVIGTIALTTPNKDSLIGSLNDLDVAASQRECRKTLIFLDKTQAFCFWIKITVIPGIFLSVLFVF